MWIIDLIREGDYISLAIRLLACFLIIVWILPIHEFAHGWVAHKLGDDTARYQGRMTLNPGAHIDPFGALFIVLFGFGWAKAVPVNPFNFKHRKRDMAITALAGPLSNVIVALIAAILYNILALVLPYGDYIMYLVVFFNWFITVNLTLAVFNLLPIPPLDGSRIFGAILPDKFVFKMQQYEQFIFIGLAVLLFTGVLDPAIWFLQSHLFDAVMWVADLPFKLFGLL